MIITIIIGIIAAIISVWIIRQVSPKREHDFWRFGLIVAALIYVGFSVFGQAWEYLPMELGGVLIYSAFAFLSKKHTQYWLALGWLLHVSWDIFLPIHQHAEFVPSWYPGVCLGFDIVIAVYIFKTYRSKRIEMA
jgi:hypothetical protein